MGVRADLTRRFLKIHAIRPHVAGACAEAAMEVLRAQANDVVKVNQCEIARQNSEHEADMAMRDALLKFLEDAS